MQVVLAAGLYPPDIGGPARYAELMVAELPKHGIAVTPVPYRQVRHWPRLVRHIGYTWYLWRGSKTADVIYALDPISVGLPALFVSWVRRRPLWVRLGGDYAWEQGVQRFGVTQTLDEYTYHTMQRPWPVRLLAWLQQFVVRRARLVVVPSQYLKRIVTTWGVAEKNLAVLYSAHSVGTVPADPTMFRTTFDYERPLFVSIARLTPWKGMATLIRVMAARQARGLGGTLLIGGEGSERTRLETLAAELGVTPVVRFLGAIPMEQVAEVVAAADVFLLDTAYEGLSHQLLEVMATGVPIITTPVGGNVELITHEVEGLLVPVGDIAAYDRAIDRLFNDETLKTNMVAKAKAKATLFAGDDAVVALVKRLESI